MWLWGAMCAEGQLPAGVFHSSSTALRLAELAGASALGGRLEDFRGRAIPNVQDWGDLDLNYKIIADIHADLCIGCQLCYVACEDGAHQCIAPYTVAGNGKKNPNGMGVHVPRIIEDECVGCNLCALVCPVEGCITMEHIDTGKPFESWNMRAKRLAGGSGATLAS